ncbi:MULTISPECIES: M48 family metallopeptidase [unclassified Thioalkalivibrio]|uniref:M48 family metallopeptidase n=1 Tax=unclassified Thioalkalivibrio TaxID=2621013 RepID=UPI00035DA525|nr:MULTISPECIES: M48 family metallopeptidase [unclassified Thioalkalivibrio]
MRAFPKSWRPVRGRLGSLLLAVLVAGGLAVAIPGCTTNPVTGRSQLMLVSESQAISASRTAYVEMLAPAREEGRINADPEMTARVHGITEKVVAQAVKYRSETADWDWEIVVIEAPDTINAFAMAGGKMAIYSGIIEQLELTDDELAQIIGHEIAHALSAHTAEKMSVALASNMAVAGYAMTGDRSQIALTGAALGAALAVQLPHSRAMEAEADEIGMELAARAGYNPDAAASLWRKMAAQSNGRHPVFLSTHPAPESRQRDLTRMADRFRPLYEEARNSRVPTHPVN